MLPPDDRGEHDCGTAVNCTRFRNEGSYIGGSAWSANLYDDRTKVRNARVSTGGAAFAYTDDVHTGKAPRAVNAKLDPKLKAGSASPFAGQVMRESRDSATHPESVPIAVFFDETGSMGGIPVVLEKKLAGLLALFVQKGIEHPQLLFGAIGDANSDRAPLQVGQFESGVEMDDVLDNIWLEGDGGGQRRETYELAHYFGARHFATDAWDKRQKKGYFFTIGDESFYPVIERQQVAKLIGDQLEANLSTEDIVHELQEKWHVFHIIAEEGGYRDAPGIEQDWKRLLNERVLKLYDTTNVAELIAMTVALTEGVTDLHSIGTDLAAIGADAHTVKTVSTALKPYAKTVNAMAKSNVTGTLPSMSGGGGVQRL